MSVIFDVLVEENRRRILELDAWLEPYRQLWSASLDALELHLDTNTASPPASTAHMPMDPPQDQTPGVYGESPR